MVDRKSGERGCRNNKSQRPPRAHRFLPCFPYTRPLGRSLSHPRLPVPADFDHVSSLAFGPSLTSILYRTGNYRIRVIHANPSARRATNYYRAIESIRVPPTPPMLFLVSPRVSQPVAGLSRNPPGPLPGFSSVSTYGERERVSRNRAFGISIRGFRG